MDLNLSVKIKKWRKYEAVVCKQNFCRVYGVTFGQIVLLVGTMRLWTLFCRSSNEQLFVLTS